MSKAAILSLVCLALLAGCGRKPSQTLPPPGTAPGSYPLTYPMEP